MHRGSTITGLLAVVLIGSAGCCTPKADGPHEPAPPVLAEVARNLASPDVSRAAEAPQPIDATAGRYYQLTAEDCRSLSCSHSVAAALIDAAAADPPDPFPWLKSLTSPDKLRRLTAQNLSSEARIRTAGAALELYYKLQETELLADVLASSQAEVDLLVESGKAMADKGFTESADYLKLRNQQVELRADRAKLQNGIRRLNAELKFLIGAKDYPGRLLPVDAVRVDPEPLDADQAVRVALSSRPDLKAIRDLAAGLDARTVDAVRQSLASFVPAIGAVTAATRIVIPGFRAIFPMLAAGDVEGLRHQLQMHLTEREGEVSKDVRATVDEWHTQRELVAVARKRQELETERVRELTVKKSKGASVEAEYHRAVIDKLTADATVIREAIKWKQIDVRARREMGLLCNVGCR